MDEPALHQEKTNTSWRPQRHLVLVMVFALVPAMVCNANSLHLSAQNQKYGYLRKALLTVTERLVKMQESIGIARIRNTISGATHQEEHDDYGSLPPVRQQVQRVSLQEPSQRTQQHTQQSNSNQAVENQAQRRSVLRQPSDENPLRIWVAGDSMARALGPAVVNHTQRRRDLVAATMFRQATGLVRPWVFDWPTRIERTVNEQRPDVVVLVFGANDDHDIVLGDRTLPFPGNDWQREYRRRVGDLMDRLRDKTLVIWMGLPPMRVQGFAQSMQVINTIYRDEARQRPWVRFFDPQPLFANDRGEYSAYLRDNRGRMVLMRASDGVHYTYEGGERLADSVIETIRNLANE